MSQLWGADAEELEHLGRQFGQAAQTVDSILRRLNARLAQTPWHGPEADRFRSDWNRRHRPQVASAAGFLRTEGSVLARQAEQQRRASSGGGGGAGGGAGWTGLAGGSRSLAATAQDTRRAMEQQLALLRAQLEAEERGARWSPTEAFKAAHPLLRTDAEILRARIRVLEGLLDGNRTFLAFSDAPGDNRIIEVYGDIATADTVIVHVPGMNTDLGAYANGHHDARALLDESTARGAKVAVVSFANYNVPDDVVEVANDRAARLGQAQLRDLVADLHTAGVPDISVVAHSYGTLVVGEAMKQGLEVDRVVAVGSPGMGATSRDGLGSPGVELYAGSSPVDLTATLDPNPLGRIETVGDYVTYAPAFGPNPIEYATTIDVAGAHGHSSYFTGSPLSHVVTAALPGRAAP